MHEEQLISIGSIIVLAVGAQWLAWRAKMPSILFLLLFGFVAGPLTGLVEPDALLGNNLFPLVSISVGIILFEGGLTLNISELPSIGGAMARLISLGALVTWIVSSLGAFFILGLSLEISILLGAILIVTGPTVVGPILRQVRPKKEVAALLKWEGILIDPVGAVIAVLVFEAILEGSLLSINESGFTLIFGILRVVIIGGLIGLAGAGIVIPLLEHHWIPDYLQNGVVVMLVVIVFAASNNLAPEAGLLGTTIMGLVLANQRRVPVNRLMEFMEDLQVLLIGVLFILLSARIPLASLVGVLNLNGAIYLLLLILVARPLSVIASTFFSDLSWQERVFTGWMAPRGIVAASVASIFALELVSHGVAGAELLAPITFLVIVGTVIVYGLSAGFVGRKLGLAKANPQGVLIIGADTISRTLGHIIQNQGFRALLVDSNHDHINRARKEGLETHYGDALAERTAIDISFSGLGRVMALTPNNEVNTLGVVHYSDEFSSQQTYQLFMGEGALNNPSRLHGRYLFSSQLNHDELAETLAEGSKIRALTFDDQLDYETFQMIYGETFYSLFVHTETDQLLIDTVDTPVVPKKGQTLIALYLPESEEMLRVYQETAENVVQIHFADDSQVTKE